jgi:hypothetical protein
MSIVQAVHYAPDGRPRCGRPDPFALTGDETAVTCKHCTALMAGGNTTSGLTWAEQPHGTLAAHRRHYRLGQKPCESCRQAKARDWEDRADGINAARRAARAGRRAS